LGRGGRGFHRNYAKQLNSSAALPLHIDDSFIRPIWEEPKLAFGPREKDPDFRADAFPTLEFDFPSVVADDAMHDQQPETRPGFFGSVVGFEDPTDLVWRHSRTIVGESENYIIVIAARPNRELPIRSHRLATVADEVVEDLLQLIVVDMQERKLLFQVETEGDSAVCDFGTDEGDRFLGEVVEVGRHWDRASRADCIEKFLDDKIEPFDLVSRDLERFE
jgi:hypothetical protein